MLFVLCFLLIGNMKLPFWGGESGCKSPNAVFLIRSCVGCVFFFGAQIEMQSLVGPLCLVWNFVRKKRVSNLGICRYPPRDSTYSLPFSQGFENRGGFEDPLLRSVFGDPWWGKMWPVLGPGVRSTVQDRWVGLIRYIPRHPVIPPEVWCLRYVFGVQIFCQEVFGCLGY